MNYKLELIGFTIKGCLVAQSFGANRIELCDNPGDGGTTPSYGFIKAARKKLSIELYPIIRPRGGDFLYSEDEFEIMKDDVKLCKKSGCDGIATGILKADGTIDTARCSELAKLAYPLGMTFHRAFDRTSDPFKAMEDIISSGFERILTSGQKPTTANGADLIAELVKQSGERIIIMPGSGVRAENIISLAEKTGALEFHTSARIFEESEMKFINKDMKEQLRSVAVDKTEISDIIKLLRVYELKKNEKAGQ